MKALDVLDLVEMTGSTKSKTQMLSGKGECELSDREMFILHFLVTSSLDYRKMFFIKNLDGIEGFGESDNFWIDQFSDILLECGKTGRTQSTQALVKEWLERQHPQVAKWCRRTILKDLRAGASIEIAKKAGIEVPSFDVQLATDGKKCKKLEAILAGGNAMVSPKLDGYRCVAINRDGHVELYSRNGILYENFPSVICELEAMMRPNIVLDGEIMSNDFNKMQQTAFANKRGTAVGDVVYHVFDSIPLEEWDRDEFTMPFAERFDTLIERSFLDVPGNVSVVPHHRVNSLEDILEYERNYLESGFEGAMVNPDIPYYRKRKANALLKFKTMTSWDCEVLGFYRGKGKYENSLGGLVVRQENGKTCEVGTGFSDEDRDFIWSNRTELLHKICEVAYQDLTPEDKMRFPVMKRWRNDKS